MSKWMNGGQPTHCAFCSQKFDGYAWHNHAAAKYFCNEYCSDEYDVAQTVEQRARRVS